MLQVTKDFPLQLSPGVYDDKIFRGLDFVLAEARKRGIRVTLVLADWWCAMHFCVRVRTPALVRLTQQPQPRTTTGVEQYVRWSRTALNNEAFYTDRTCIEHYKRNALSIIMRRNTGVCMQLGNWLGPTTYACFCGSQWHPLQGRSYDLQL